MTKDNDKQSIGEQLSELEAIIQWFEQQKAVDVEEGLKMVKRGAELIRGLRLRLRQSQNEFEEIKKDLLDEE